MFMKKLVFNREKFSGSSMVIYASFSHASKLRCSMNIAENYSICFTAELFMSKYHNVYFLSEIYIYIFYINMVIAVMFVHTCQSYVVKVVSIKISRTLCIAKLEDEHLSLIHI